MAGINARDWMTVSSFHAGLAAASQQKHTQPTESHWDACWDSYDHEQGRFRHWARRDGQTFEITEDGIALKESK